MKWDVFLVINGHTNHEISLLLTDSMHMQAILKTLHTDYLLEKSIAFFCCVLPSNNTKYITDGDFSLHYPCPAISN